MGNTSGLSYDEAGNIAQVNSTSGSSDYQFDDTNRLKAMISRDAAGVAQSKTEFVYDGMRRLRISKHFTWSNGAWIAQSEKRRIYDGLNVAQERDVQGDLIALYIRGIDMGGGIGGLLARVFDVGTSFMHYDGRGNVVQLTDASGSVSGKYTYDAFGNTLSQTGGAAGLNPYRFSTKEHFGSLVYYGYRFYSPSLGKWINRDPLKEAGGTNLYSFASNQPTQAIDTDGRAVWIFLAVFVVAIAGAGTLTWNCYEKSDQEARDEFSSHCDKKQHCMAACRYSRCVGTWSGLGPWSGHHGAVWHENVDKFPDVDWEEDVAASDYGIVGSYTKKTCKEWCDGMSDCKGDGSKPKLKPQPTLPNGGIPPKDFRPDPFKPLP